MKKKQSYNKARNSCSAEQLEVKERFNRALRSVTVIEVQIEEQVPQQVAQLEEVIQSYNSASQT
jgi:hypothetical protein